MRTEKKGDVDNEMISVSDLMPVSVPVSGVEMVEVYVTDKLGSQTELTVTSAPNPVHEGKSTDLDLDLTDGSEELVSCGDIVEDRESPGSEPGSVIKVS